MFFRAAGTSGNMAAPEKERVRGKREGHEEKEEEVGGQRPRQRRK